MQPINHKPKTINHKPETLIFAALALLAFAIYYRGLAPSVATIFDDSLEFPLVVHRLAIAHPTGYPLYILLGRLFALFNPANIAYQLNLMSAVFGALAAGAVYLLGLRLAAPEADWTAHAGAALGALVFGTGPLFYSQATIAEVYTLNALFVAGTLLLALQQRWAGLAFLFGLSLTHHRTMLLLVPALALFVAVAYRLPRREGWRQVRGDVPILKTIIRFAAPLLLYLYLPLRGQAGSLDGTYQNSLSGFWRHVAGGGYSTFLQNNSLGNEPSLNFYVSLLKNEAGWWGLGLAVVGLAWLAGGRRWKGLALTGPACAIYFGFNVAYAVSDIEVFFIPVFLLLALWAGLGLGAILRGLARRRRAAAVAAAGLALALTLFPQRGHSRAGDWAVYDYGLDALTQPAPHATVVGILGEMTLLRYFQETAGLRPDVQTVAADREAERLARVSRLLAEQPARPVYLTRELNGAPERWSLGAEGPLIRVRPEPVPAPPPVQTRLNTPLTPEITLTGYSASRPAAHRPVLPLRLSLVWQVNRPVAASLKVSARLLNQNGELVAVVDTIPVHFAYPTRYWRPGEFITDVYDLELPPETPPGAYTPLILLYDPARNAAEVGRVALAPIVVD